MYRTLSSITIILICIFIAKPPEELRSDIEAMGDIVGMAEERKRDYG